MKNSIKINFTYFNEEWISLMLKLSEKMNLEWKDAPEEISGADVNIVEIEGEFETIEIFRQLIEMSDGGSIV